MTFKRIGGVWIAWCSVNKVPFVAFGQSIWQASHKMNIQISEYLK